jgi:DNA phosphorothioation-associated putative methyltransferase
VSKRAFGHRYLHVSALTSLPREDLERVGLATRHTGLVPGKDFDVVKLHREGNEVSLLAYPRFFEEPFPVLTRSWRVRLPEGQWETRDYADSLNPPILHRKELLLLPDHPLQPSWRALTATAEQLGLFDDPVRIGYRVAWESLIAERGYTVHNGAFVPLGNAEEPGTAPRGGRGPRPLPPQIERHRTALARDRLSAPVQALLRHGLLAGSELLDYGCGRGDDVRGLAALGIPATGWDPHFAPDAPRVPAPVVNLGFVLNVIEALDERVAALREAWGLSRRVLAVATLVAAQNDGTSCPYADGVVTSRGTFQKYFSQAELAAFLREVLAVDPIPVAPGLFFIFRDGADAHRFLVDRQRGQGPRLVHRGLRRVSSRPLGGSSPRRGARHVDPVSEGLLDAVHARWLDLGRPPESDECPDREAVEATFGTLGRALRRLRARGGSEVYTRAGEARRDDLIVWLAGQVVAGKKPAFHQLDAGLQRDVKTLLGGLAPGLAAARRILFGLADADALVAAVHTAAEQGLGCRDAQDRLTLDARLIGRLPVVLRTYVACATALYGDPRESDLIRIHPRSHKLTLLRYEDFQASPLPRLRERVKLRFRDQGVDLFRYGSGDFPSPVLLGKSRCQNEELPGYVEQAAFDEALQDLGLFNPDETLQMEQVVQRLADARYAIDGFRLTRSTSNPSLDAPCGRYLRYRDLIECGETWQRTRLPNLPREPESFAALRDLTFHLLDPIIDWFGMIRITYAFGSPALARQIPGGVAPRLDQHAACERNRRGDLVCARRGAAVDFVVDDEDMSEVADWIVAHLPFDRLYYYGRDRPLHLSYGPEQRRERVDMRENGIGRRMPRRRVRSRTLDP